MDNITVIGGLFDPKFKTMPRRRRSFCCEACDGGGQKRIRYRHALRRAFKINQPSTRLCILCNVQRYLQHILLLDLKIPRDGDLQKLREFFWYMYVTKILIVAGTGSQ